MAGLKGGGLKGILGLADLESLQAWVEQWRSGSSGGRSKAGRLFDEESEEVGANEGLAKRPVRPESDDAEEQAFASFGEAPTSGSFYRLQSGATASPTEADTIPLEPDTHGLAITVLTSGVDNWTGTAGVDSLDGLDGNDTLTALDGNDTIFASSGNDRVFGGSGNDYLFGGPGDDYAAGGAGADTLYGGAPAYIADPADGVIHVANALRDGRPFVAATPDGGYFVAWEQGIVAGSDETREVLFRRYASDGTTIGGVVDFDTQAQTNNQLKGDLEIAAMLGPNAGRVVVVWYSDENPPDDNNGADGILDTRSAFMQVLEADGTPVTIIEEVDRDNSFSRSNPTVTALPDGTYIVIYQDQYRDTNGVTADLGIYAQQYILDGAPTPTKVGDAIRINETLNGDQTAPRSALLANGDVAVVWTSNAGVNVPGPDAGTGVYLRIIRTDQTPPLEGTPAYITGELRVNSTTSGDQRLDQDGIAPLAGGGFVVVWEGNGTDSVSGTADASGVWFQVFNGAGQRLDHNGNVVVNPSTNSERLLATTTGGTQTDAAVASLLDGGFFAVWSGPAAGLGDASGSALIGQRFDALGNRIGGEILINTTLTGDQTAPAMAQLANGTVVVVWEGQGTTGTDNDIFQRAFRFGDGGGNDTLLGDDNADIIFGESGADSLYGGSAADTIDGGSGVDSLYGGQAIDLLFGGAGGDTLEGGAQADQLSGGAGGDFASYLSAGGAVTVDLSAGTGFGSDAAGDTLTTIEHLYGSQFDDTLTGLGSNGIVIADNSLVGNDGQDSLYGLSGADRLYGGSGNDLLVGGADGDQLFGGAGLDIASYFGSSAGVAVDLSTGNGFGGEAAGDSLTTIEHLYGSQFNDTLIGLGSNGVVIADNSLVGNDGQDSLYGLSGNDVLYGGSGDDLLVGGADADQLFGGAGLDTASYASSNAGIHIVLSNATPETGGHAEGDFLTGVENIIGSAFDDTIAGSADATANAFYGGAGNDTFDGRQGGDTLDGGAGADWSWYVISGLAVTVDLSDGLAERGGHAEGDTLISIEHVLGSRNDDTLIGDAGGNSLVGASGNDRLVAGNGADALFGGTGSDLMLDGSTISAEADTFVGGDDIDTVSYDGVSAGVIAHLLNGNGTAGTALGDSYFEVENLIGSSYADGLIGDHGVNTLWGGDGDDSLNSAQGSDTMFGGTGNDELLDGLGAGQDVFDGGVGNDTASYFGAGAGLAASLLAGVGYTGSAAGDTYISIENLNGGNGGDTLIGDNAANTLQGQDGDDTILGTLGADAIFGGTGADKVAYFTAIAQIDGGVGVDTVYGTAAADVVNLGLSQFGAPTAGPGGQQVYSNGNVEVFELLGGNDTFYGAGNSSTAIASNATVFGGDGDDDLTMRANASDSLFGGSGNDTLEASTGADLLDGGAGSDAARYLNSNAGVTVDLSDGLAESGGTAQGDSLTGIENLIGSSFGDTLTGNGSVNWLRGEAGNDLLDGGAGADSLFGGLGNDRLMFDVDDVAIMGGAGVDTLIGRNVQDIIQLNQARWSFDSEFAAIEQYNLGDGNDWFLNTDSAAHLSAMATTGLRVFGGSGNDSISMRGAGAASGIHDTVDGGAGNDQIWGGWGNDTLIGGGGNDYIYGGKGNDSMAAGSGFDVFYVGVDEGDDVITSAGSDGGNGLVLFWGHDSTFGGNYDGVDPSEISIVYGASDVTINLLNSGTSVTFQKGEVTILNLWDYGDGDAGNGPTAPGTFERDVWSATWDGDEFTPFVLAVDG